MPTPETPLTDASPSSVRPDGMHQHVRRRMWLGLCALSVIELGLTAAAIAQPVPAPPARNMPTPESASASPQTLGELPRTTLPPATLLPMANLIPTDVTDEQKRVRVIAVLPMRSLLARASELLAPNTARPHTANLVGLERRVVSALQGRDFVQVLSPAVVRRRLAADRGLTATARAAHARYRLGLEYYLGLSSARAIQSLEESVGLYRSIYQDVSSPKAHADAQFMLGVSLVDAGNTVQGHVALKAAFAIQPRRRFRQRFFPPRVERALHAALTDYLSTGAHTRPFGDATRLGQLARRLKVDAVVTVAVRFDANHNPEVLLSAYHARRNRFEADVRLPMAATSTQLEPALARWLDCVPISSRSGSRAQPASQRVFMDTSAAYALYLRQPTRQLFHSVGFAAGVAWQVRPGLEWFVRGNMFTSLSDPYRDLLQAFNSVRVLVGVGFALQWRYIRLWARPGIDVHAFGRFIATTDPNCKLFGEEHRLCDAETVSSLNQDYLAGFHLALGGDVALGRRFFVTARVSGTAYILPLSSADDLNYPVGLEAGLGYRF